MLELLHEFIANPDPLKWAALVQLAVVIAVAGGSAFLVVREVLRGGR